MKINCLHGYFKFFETRAGEISEFMSLFEGLSIVAKEDHYVFEFLEDAPTHSIAGGTFLGVPTISTFEGPPWEVMRKNGIVYDFNTGLALPIASVLQRVSVSQAANYFLSPGLLLPGSFMKDGTRITDYNGYFVFDSNKFKYSEISENLL